MKAMVSPCAACPWRRANQGKPHPGGWYTKANLRRLWAGLRSGEAPGMTCHPTDPNNPIPEGHRGVPVGVETRECAGALLVVQRELRLLEKDPGGYLKARGRIGLNRYGAMFWAVSRAVLAGTALGGEPMMVVEDDADIGYAPLDATPSNVGRAR